MKIKLTLKYSSFFFTNDVCLAKNVTQEIDTDKLSNKDKGIINAYIQSGAIVSDKGLIEIEDEVVVVEPTPVVEVPVVEEVVAQEAEVPKQDAEPEVVEEAPTKKKPAAAKKVVAKK